MPITIIIPNRNQLSYLQKCIDSIIKYTSMSHEIIVVDNGSNQEATDWIRNSGIKHILVPDNIGFARAINLAISGNSNDCVLLNNDVEVSPGWLEGLTKFGDNTIVGCIGMYPDGQVQHAGATITPYGNGMHFKEIPKVPTEYEYVSFFCVYIPRAVINKVGYLDNAYYPAYYDDPDYCYAARQKGVKILLNPEVKVIHHEGMGKKEHGLNIKELNDTSRRKFFLKTEDYDLTEDKKYKVTFEGRVAGGLSYPTILKKLAQMLDNDPDVDVSILSDETIYGQHIHEWPVKKLMMKPFDPNRICIRYAEAKYAYMAYNRDIIYCTLEVDRWPKEWIRNINMFKRAWTTTQFIADIMINNGVHIPIDVIPHGIDFKVWYPRPKKSKVFTFVTDAMYGPRKNMDMMFRAFIDEFPNDNVKLRVHSSNIEQQFRENIGVNNFGEYLDKLGGGNMKDKIAVSQDWKSIEEMVDIYSEGHCYIGVGSEGFGLGNLQAMAMKIPTICLDWGGVTDYSNDKTALLVKSRLVPAFQPWLCDQYVRGNWAAPEYMSLRKQMRYAYEHPEEIKGMAEEAFTVAQTYTWKSVAEKCKLSIEKVWNEDALYR
jgi:hypothetical protein